MQAATNLDEMLLLAENGEWRENVKDKHRRDAQNGWYRYETQFAVPVLNAKKAVDHYTVYSGTLLIRNDADGKSYLYDMIDVEKKKVISSPSFSAQAHSDVFEPKPSQAQYTRGKGGSQAESSGKEQLSVRGKYWRPDLNRSEWNLLNRRLEEEIESSGQYLDESTKWLYADEKGVQVFALYGIGDGTDATPLYAVGGKQATAYNAAVIEYIERREKYDGNGGSADSWVELLRSKKGRRSRNISQAKGSAGVAGTVYGLHGGSQNGDVRGTSGRSTQDQRGVKEKFSLRAPVERTKDLVAVHNLTEQNLRDAFYLGGLPMPSIAVVKAALEKLPVYRGTVYRHYDFDSFGGYDAMAEFLSMFEKGEATPMKSYLSAGTVRNEDRTNGEYTIDMVIQSETGRSLNGFGRNTENEVLLPRTTELIADSMELISPHKVRIIAREDIKNGEGATADAGAAGMRDVREGSQGLENLRPVSGRNSEEVQGQGRRDPGRDRDAGLSGLREGEGSGSLGKSGVESDYRAAEEGLKYQPREQSVSDRQILANVLERVAQNERERSILADYREKAAKMAFYERELAKREQKIADHRSGKAVLEPDKIRRAEVSAQKYAALISQQEWNLLNRRMTEEIESSEQYLDEATKWLYADKKGVQVFALCGIGDGTEATPLYAVGGKQARADAAALMAYIKEEREYDGNRKDLDTLLEGYGRSNRDGRSNLFDRKRGSAENRTAGLHRGSQGRDAGGTSGRGTQNQPGIREKFSLRDSAERERPAAQQVLSTH